ncbi:MAG TPA: hypothetical protein RMH80_09840, partial [Polyangiaceae bacterium LLY-WYZ-15_(1-7)]|nr:hypothetical protein [Polyangiaceae bacterium LLY-WYZ-15_(1-7)]
AFYLRARCAEDAEAARTDLQRAAMLGEERGDASLVAGARARLARRGVGQAGEEPLEALALAPRERLAALAAKLQTKGRYGRVAALDGLIELAAQEERSDPEVARAARRLAARHADAEGRLTPIEIDRVRTLLRGWPDAAERELALARLAARDAVLQEAEGAASDAPAASDAIRRARAVLEHGSAGPPKGAPTPTWRALDLVAAARREEPLLDRAEALDAAVRASRPPVTAPLLTAAWIARRSRDGRTAVAGERIATRLAALAEGVAPEALPTRGWLRLADAVSDAPLAAALLSFAVAAREPGAEDRRAEALVRRGWEAFRAGEEEEALEALRAARALVEG